MFIISSPPNSSCVIVHKNYLNNISELKLLFYLANTLIILLISISFKSISFSISDILNIFIL